MTGGKLSISDKDTDDVIFVPQTSSLEIYGSFTITPEGFWNYVLNKADVNVQGLKKGHAITETIEVSTSGGAIQDITIVISGGSGGSGSNEIIAGAGNNTINVVLGKYHITSGSGNDIITTGSADDVLYAGNGNNIINSGGGNDRITSGEGDDTITSIAGRDIISAGNGNNIVNGGKGKDKIVSGNGDDVINGGGGADTMTGGLGKDTFVFDNLAKGAADKITDFDSTYDLLLFDVLVFASLVDGVSIDSLVIEAKPEAYDGNDYFLFDTKNSRLYFDSDGNGSDKAFALVTLTGVQTLDSDNFSVF